MTVGRLIGNDLKPRDPHVGGPNKRRTAKGTLAGCGQTEFPQSFQWLPPMPGDRRLAILWVWEERRWFYRGSAELVALDEKPCEVLAIFNLLRQPGREHGFPAE
jgi:hypothetical protein